MNYKKILAGTLATTMVLSSSLMVFADNTSTATVGGAGTLEGVVDTDVFSVTLPTASTDTFNYYADPQGLIAKTNAAKYAEGTTFGEGTIFFKNSDTSYTNKSQSLTATNLSSKPVTLTITATATAGTGDDDAALASSSTLNTTKAEVYLSIGSADDDQIALTADGATITKVLGAAPEDAYEYTYNTEKSAYQYALKTNAATTYKFPEYSVYVTGAASENGWKEGAAVPSISVVWNAAFATEDEAKSIDVKTPAQDAAPSIATTTYRMVADTDVVIQVDLGLGTLAATDITSAYWTGYGELLVADDTSYAFYDADSKTVTITKKSVNAFLTMDSDTQNIRVTFSDGTEKDVTLTK
jgi:hypothetical protein